MEGTDKNILVSVCMITYNHEPFIAQAIEGVLMQETDFQIELVIGEDCSTDKTRDICKKYKKEFPNKIKLLLPEENLGIIKNSLLTLNACKGKYIAICEGDDYWTDPKKLKKQVEFLESNPEYGMIHTDYDTVDESNQPIKTVESKLTENNLNGDIFESFLKKKYSIASLTVLFQRQLFVDFEKELYNLDLKMTDLPMWLEFSKQSKVKFLNEKTSIYRHRQHSASHSDNIAKTLNFNLNILQIRLYFANKHQINFNKNKATAKIYSNLLNDCFKYNNSMIMTYYFKMLQFNILTIFNPRSLLFVLASKFSLFRKIIRGMQNSNSKLLKKHLS